VTVASPSRMSMAATSSGTSRTSPTAASVRSNPFKAAAYFRMRRISRCGTFLVYRQQSAKTAIVRTRRCRIASIGYSVTNLLRHESAPVLRSIFHFSSLPPPRLSRESWPSFSLLKRPSDFLKA
jgi:hypothetical protein